LALDRDFEYYGQRLWEVRGTTEYSPLPLYLLPNAQKMRVESIGLISCTDFSRAAGGSAGDANRKRRVLRCAMNLQRPGRIPSFFMLVRG
jgi:hypothetical protein